MAKDDGKTPKLKLNSIAWIGVFAFVCFTTFGAYLITKSGNLELSSAASFGDYLGGTLNPVFALLGIFLLAMTLHQNNVALELTRAELEKSAEQMKLSADALSKQEQHMRLESAEKTIIFICQEIENIYHLETGKRALTPEGLSSKTLLSVSKDIFSALEIGLANAAIRAFLDFEEGFDRAIILLIQLAKLTLDKEQAVKEHLLVIISCKLELEFLWIAYIKTSNAAVNGDYLYSKEQLEPVLALMLAISELVEVSILEHPVYLCLSEK
ncbi:hypothetical protein [Rheinheimera sp. EpRS3]|uniref:hypothetical protein n=1 Tax=Rheinheimera sp. EpRS3 TaxID=1712383 RepID=UPI00074965B5|nr:hypothetical protein [Rheinheimera sp. EpRS3]KUM54727.1 hypothetical protein AR688_15750 [Rheinheimera sp. EpRS3]